MYILIHHNMIESTEKSIAEINTKKKKRKRMEQVTQIYILNIFTWSIFCNKLLTTLLNNSDR